MSQQIEIHAELRSDVGKGASRRLRRSTDRVPGIIYGGSDDPISLSLAVNELNKAMEQESFYSQILKVHLDGKETPAVVRDIQRNPASSKVVHVDFLRVSMDKEIAVHIPLHFLNEDTCVGVKQQGGIVMRNVNEVEVSCLPAKLPEYLELDVAALEIGDVLHLSDIPLPEGVELVELSHDDPDRNLSVVSIQQPRAAVEAEAEAEGEEEAGAEAAEEAGSEDSDNEDS